jgi:AcrR family transcriptional regulator
MDPQPATSTSPRRSPRTVRPARADVRDRVLDAAREVFGEVGYHGAALDVIAGRAGFSKGAVYSNFAGKDDLFLALVEQEIARIRDEIAAALEAVDVAGSSSGGLVRDLVVLAEGLLSLARSGRAQLVFAEFRAHAAGDPGLARLTAEVRSALVNATAEQLEQVVRARGLRLTIDARDAATVLLSLSNGLALEQVGRTDDVLSATSLATVLSSLVATDSRHTEEIP